MKQWFAKVPGNRAVMRSNMVVIEIKDGEHLVATPQDGE